MKIKQVLALLFCALCICACSGGSDDESGGITPVSYTLDPQTGPACHNTTDINDFTRGDYHSIDCIWKCAGYKGQQGVYVSLDFEQRGSGDWVLDHEYVSSGICY